jgi:hypothetical protein
MDPPTIEEDTKMSKPERSGLHEATRYQECLERIDRLRPDSVAQWGTMSAAQMLSHCAEVQDVSNGSRELRGTPFLVKLFKGVIRRMVLSDKPYPKSTGTHPQYVQRLDKDFEAEKQRLLSGLEVYRQLDPSAAERIVHPLFGKLSFEEKGFLTYKHLDHHLKQFGV